MDTRERDGIGYTMNTPGDLSMTVEPTDECVQHFMDNAAHWYVTAILRILRVMDAATNKASWLSAVAENPDIFDELEERQLQKAFPEIIRLWRELFDTEISLCE